MARGDAIGATGAEAGRSWESSGESDAPVSRIRATVRTADRTGVEMEALTSVNVAALAIVDMIKGVDRSAEITDCRIIHKAGGRSGDWFRPGYGPEDLA